MGKLHGLCIGLDVCSTLHMDVSLDDLDWCLDQVMPANPAYLMALPTKIDPMLGYLTTGFQDHVRLREKFGYKVNDRTWRFFQELGVIDARGGRRSTLAIPLGFISSIDDEKATRAATARFWAKADADGSRAVSRRVSLLEGHGQNPWDLDPELDSIPAESTPMPRNASGPNGIPSVFPQISEALPLATQSANRTDYILHPTPASNFRSLSEAKLLRLRERQAGEFDVQIVVSDGLNALAIMDQGHLAPSCTASRMLIEGGFPARGTHVVVTSGRVRAGYHIGETLFANRVGRSAILHVIGERPGTGHHTFSVYITSATGSTWSQPGKVDHNITKVVSGIAVTALSPIEGALETVRLLKLMS